MLKIFLQRQSHRETRKLLWANGRKKMIIANDGEQGEKEWERVIKKEGKKSCTPSELWSEFLGHGGWKMSFSLDRVFAPSWLTLRRNFVSLFGQSSRVPWDIVGRWPTIFPSDTIPVARGLKKKKNMEKKNYAKKTSWTNPSARSRGMEKNNNEK